MILSRLTWRAGGAYICGGDVGARKAAYFEREAEVTVISRSFAPALDDPRYSEGPISQPSRIGARELLRDTSLWLRRRRIRPQHRIGRLCADAGVLFNNASGEAGNVTIHRSFAARTTWLRSALERVPPYRAISACDLRRIRRPRPDDRPRMRCAQHSRISNLRTPVRALNIPRQEIWGCSPDYGRARAMAMERHHA